MFSICIGNLVSK